MQPPDDAKAANADAVGTWRLLPAAGTCRAPLLIVGASARAAAQSAWRAGLQPRAADMFADLDLRRLSGARAVPDYPDGLISHCRQLGSAPWLYTGALENYPHLVDELAAQRPLLGNDSSVLHRVRDPWQLAAAARQAGWRSPALRPWGPGQRDAKVEDSSSDFTFPAIGRACAASPGTPRQWLCKPFRSAGGSQIHWWDTPLPVGTARRGDRSNWYLQQFVPGQSQSAAFVAARGRAVLLGTSLQLIGCRWLGTSGFQFGGSLGPLPLASTDEPSLVDLGNQLAREFNLVGLFGVDYVVTDAGPYVIEVNPRYTASMEILERAARFWMVGVHTRACQQGLLPDMRPPCDGRIWGKAIVYARRGTRISRHFCAWVERANRGPDWPVVADIPTFGQWIPRGRPVTTVFAVGASIGQVLGRLKRRVSIVQRLLETENPRFSRFSRFPRFAAKFTSYTVSSSPGSRYWCK